MVTVVSNYCQLSQTQLSQTFAEKFTVTEELLQSLKKTALSGDEESIELLHNIALGYDKFGKEAEDILYHIVRTPTNETLSIIRLIKNACLKLYNLAHTATNFPLKPTGPDNSDVLLFKKLFSPSKLMTIIGDEIPLISEKQSLSKVLLNDENNELSDGTNFWDKNRQLTTDEIACYLQKIAANAKNTQVNYPTGLYVPYSTRTHLEDALNENIKSDPSWPNEVQLFPINTGGHWILVSLQKIVNKKILRKSALDHGPAPWFKIKAFFSTEERRQYHNNHKIPILSCYDSYIMMMSLTNRHLLKSTSYCQIIIMKLQETDRAATERKTLCIQKHFRLSNTWLTLWIVMSPPDSWGHIWESAAG